MRINVYVSGRIDFFELDDVRVSELYRKMGCSVGGASYLRATELGKKR